MCLERLLRAEADAVPLGEPGQSLWSEIETAAKRRRAEGWPSEDDDPERYSALSRASDHRYLMLAERLRCYGTLTAPPNPLTDWQRRTGSPADTYSKNRVNGP
jgi:hypothetical protein